LLRRFAPRNDGHCERSEAIQKVRYRAIFNWHFNKLDVLTYGYGTGGRPRHGGALVTERAEHDQERGAYRSGVKG